MNELRTPRPVSARRGWRVLLCVAVLMTIAALIQGHHRASKGQNALLRWAPVYDALEAGEPIYRTGEEGYPTPPVTLLLMAPFHACGPTLGPLLWAVFKLGISWWIVWSALRLAAGAASRWPPWAAGLVLLLSFRVLYSDVQHGNINLVVGATVLAAVVAFARGRDTLAGVWIGVGAVLKVTPVLGVLWLLRRGSWRGLGGVVLGVVLAAVVLPGLWLGFGRNLELHGEWWRQMVAPYLGGRELGIMQTEHINQSLFGWLARLTTDSIAIEARPPVHSEAVRVHLLALDVGAFRALHLGLSGLLVAVLLVSWSRDRRPLVLLGEGALLALAMVFLSERSWKHHYVLLALPVAFLTWCWVVTSAGDPRRRLAGAGLALAFALFGLSGEALLGEGGSDLAEAWGAYLLGGIALFCASASILRRGAPLEAAAPYPIRAQSWPDEERTTP